LSPDTLRTLKIQLIQDLILLLMKLELQVINKATLIWWYKKSSSKPD